ncbi:hypothetical protein Ccrd_020041 [Cynara cardunculus var. scolymus]|uniref:Uncharacterized protein n=1 Tax=Cynara cardunculus var. scolymus TaxID=59895 RepID=A0A118K0Z5_CYNCS|nr:hypothetical protein Ccrd_020041 [Cynara cardunculus var. scolymus]
MKPIAISNSVSSSLFVSPYANGCASSSKIVAQKNKNSQSPKGSEPPARITSNVKQNLQFLRLWKEYQKRKSSTPKPATSYRKKKVEKDDLPDDDSELYHTAVPVLLVDGYNVCGYWPKLKKHFLGGRLDLARQKLVDELITFGMLRVQDGRMSSAIKFFEVVDIVYSTETCADAWIEKEDMEIVNKMMNKLIKLYDKPMKMKSTRSEPLKNTRSEEEAPERVAALREDGCPRVWVVTSDRCQQHAAHGAVLQRHWSRRSTSVQGKLLKHNLDSGVVDALKDLRNKLSETESRG